MARLVCPTNTHVVYVLCNASFNRVYYGCTVLPMESRMGHHMQALSRGYHGNRELQAMYDQQPNGWTVHQVAKLPGQEADAFETELIQGDPNCVNVQKSAGRKAPRYTKVDQRLIAAVEALLPFKRQYEIAGFLDISAAEISKISRRQHSLQGAA